MISSWLRKDPARVEPLAPRAPDAPFAPGSIACRIGRPLLPSATM